MISFFLTLLLLVPIVCAADEGNWGAVALCVVIILFIWFMRYTTVQDAKAYVNRRDYWANGGPNGEENQRSVVVHEVRHERSAANADAERRRKHEEARKEAVSRRIGEQARQGRKEGSGKDMGIMGGYYRK